MKLSMHELELARTRISEELATYDSALHEAKWSAAKAVALDLKLQATISPTEENLAAAAQAQLDWQAAGEELEHRSDHARHLQSALERVQTEIRQAKFAAVEGRKQKAAKALREKLEAKAPDLVETLIQVVELVSLEGGQVSDPQDILIRVERITDRKAMAIIREGRERAQAIKTGTNGKEATP